jgi:hypothetical protein
MPIVSGALKDKKPESNYSLSKATVAMIPFLSLGGFSMVKWSVFRYYFLF